MDISGIFVCSSRPNLTELCFERFDRKAGDIIDQKILVYEGNDQEYLDRVRKTMDFDEIVFREMGDKHDRFPLVKEGYDKADGDAFFQLQNDFYIEDREHLVKGLKALKNSSVDFLRLESIDVSEHDIDHFIDFQDFRIAVCSEIVYFQFNLNPHLRTQKFPFTEAFDQIYENRDRNVSVEGVLSKEWKKKGFQSAYLWEDSFRHLGIATSNGLEELSYLDRFTLRKNTEKSDFDPLEEFKKFSENQREIELFKKFLRKNFFDDNQ